VPSWRLIAALAYLALLGSVCGYLLWFHLLTVSAASAYHFLMPPLGLVFAWALLGEHVAPADLAGMSRSRSASISSRARRRPRRASERLRLPVRHDRHDGRQQPAITRPLRTTPCDGRTRHRVAEISGKDGRVV
jgi:hypothetical protein